MKKEKSTIKTITKCENCSCDVEEMVCDVCGFENDFIVPFKPQDLQDYFDFCANTNS